MGLLAWLLAWLTGDDATIPHWTPRRAHQAERDTLLASGVVVEPHWLWSLPAQQREQMAKRRREQSWRKRTQATEARRA